MFTRQFRRFASLSAALLAALLLISGSGSALAAPNTATYEITITNLTQGQPLTPPVVVTHRQPISIFNVGAPAGPAIQAIAENGNNALLLDALDGNKHVFDYAQAGGGPLVPAGTPGAATFPDSVTFTIDSATGARYFSFAAMLVCTNDGFTGLDSLRLPKKVGDTTTAYAGGYDAGTEINTEDFADIVPPCQGLIGVTSDDSGTGMSNPALAEGGVVSHHPGIQGGEDLLPAVHGWSDPVASITITRIQ